MGLFAVFEAGLLKLRCHVVDALPQPGGQLSEIYPKKPIYDIPGFPEILAGDLVQNLHEARLSPSTPPSRWASGWSISKSCADGSFELTTTDGTLIAVPGRGHCRRAGLV